MPKEIVHIKEDRIFIELPRTLQFEEYLLTIYNAVNDVMPSLTGNLVIKYSHSIIEAKLQAPRYQTTGLLSMNIQGDEGTFFGTHTYGKQNHGVSTALRSILSGVALNQALHKTPIRLLSGTIEHPNNPSLKARLNMSHPYKRHPFLTSIRAKQTHHKAASLAIVSNLEQASNWDTQAQLFERYKCNY